MTVDPVEVSSVLFRICSSSGVLETSLERGSVVPNLRPDPRLEPHGATSPLAVSISAYRRKQPGVPPTRRRGCGHSFHLTVLSLNIRSLAEQGKIKFATERLQTLGVDVCCFQETRLREHIKIDKVDDYHIFSTPASRHKGGLFTMILDRKGLQALDYMADCPRVSCLTVLVNGGRVHIVNVHAPTTESSVEEHHDFACQLDHVLSIISGGRLLVCGDLNARLGGLDYVMIGPFAISHCPQRAAHRRTALDRLQASKVFALNTFFGGIDDFTWIHPSG
eukprot:3338833-Amphidinium_carterae.3